MIPNEAIRDNLFPGLGAFGERKLEKELLLFADARKTHAAVGNLSEIDAYLDYAEQCGSGFDWVQLLSGYLMNHAPLDAYPDSGIAIDELTNDFLDKAIAKARVHGKKVCYMVGDFAPLDSLLFAYPEVRNLQNGLFWTLIHDAVVGILKRFPDLDEFGVYFFESANLLHYTNFFKCMHYGAGVSEHVMHNHPERMRRQDACGYPYLSFGDHLRMLLQAMARACKACGKGFKLLTHAWFPYQEDLLYDALKDFPSDLPITLEHNYSTGDFNPHLPAPALIRRLPHMRHTLVFCCGMEYYGLALVPCCFPESIQEIIHYAMAATPNLTRIVVRPVWDGHSLLGTPNEVNLFAILKTADFPLADTESLWDAWIAKQYGLATEAKRAALAAALRRSYDVVKKVFFEFGIRTNDHSHLPSFAHLESRLHNYGKALAIWSPTPENVQNVYDLLVCPGEKILRKHSELHQDSLRLIDEALALLFSLQDDLSGDEYANLVSRYEDMRIWTQMHRDQYGAYIRLLIHRRTPSEENTLRAKAALEALEAIASKIRAGEVRDCYLFSLDHIDDFVMECRKQFKNLYS